MDQLLVNFELNFQHLLNFRDLGLRVRLLGERVTSAGNVKGVVRILVCNWARLCALYGTAAQSIAYKRMPKLQWSTKKPSYP